MLMNDINEQMLLPEWSVFLLFSQTVILRHTWINYQKTSLHISVLAFFQKNKAPRPSLLPRSSLQSIDLGKKTFKIGLFYNKKYQRKALQLISLVITHICKRANRVYFTKIILLSILLLVFSSWPPLVN